MEAFFTTMMFTLVQLGLRMAPMMLTPVTTRCECLVAELALERPLAGVYSLVNLEVRLVSELLSADVLIS